MKRLTLMRHADAQWRDPNITDFDRPLNRRGSAEAEAMSRRLGELGLVPAVLLTSTARRAQQTAEIVARQLGMATRLVHCEESLYLAAAPEILRLVHALGPRITHVMVVGHNPGITEAAQLMAPGSELQALGTAAVCSLTFNARSWLTIGAETLSDAQVELPPARRLAALWAS